MPMAMTEPPIGRRGGTMPRQGSDGYDQTWYPIVLSREVGIGQVVASEFLDGRVIVYRGESGRVAVLSAYCRHLGADLSLGKVFGTNTITLSGRMAGADLLTLFSGVPLPGGHTRGWVVTATRGNGDEAEVAARLAAGEAFFLGLIAEDNPIMQTIRFREDVLLPADRALSRFLAYVRGYPRAHPSADFIR